MMYCYHFTIFNRKSTFGYFLLAFDPKIKVEVSFNFFSVLDFIVKITQTEALQKTATHYAANSGIPTRFAVGS